MRIRTRVRPCGKIWESGLATLDAEPTPRPRATVVNRTGRYVSSQAIPAGTELEIEAAAEDRAGNRTLARRRLKVPA